MSDLIVKTLPSNVRLLSLQISTQLFAFSNNFLYRFVIVESDSKRSKRVLDKISTKFIRDKLGRIIPSPTKWHAASLRYFGFTPKSDSSCTMASIHWIDACVNISVSSAKRLRKISTP